MSRAADDMRSRSSQVAADLVAEMGKTIAKATVEATKAADTLDHL
jgi:acyl-CoA reductase-like NAD-dependent aldehyde dehydrogenase